MAEPITKERLQQLLARVRAQSAPSPVVPTQTVAEDIKDAITDEPSGTNAAGDFSISHIPTIQPESNGVIYDKYGKLIELNNFQRAFVELAGSGKSCVLIGAAGTGKTTCQRAVTQSLIFNNSAGILESAGHKHLSSGSPGIVICAYTRRAVANIRRNMSAELQGNCITIHKLLEYQPTFYEVTDPTTGDHRTKMVFEPNRHGGNPLPATIRTIIFEESSMIGTDLHQEVVNACGHNVQFIYLGDIQQLPPVFGPAILGFKLLELPVVELTEVYRQALESPIISLAHRILSGNPIPHDEYKNWKTPGQLTIHPWKKRIDALNATNTLGAFFVQAATNGVYDPEEDVILIPYNKACGSIEINLILANHLSHARGAMVHQIVAGFNKLHLSVGDKVLFDKEDATITRIEKNPSYTGAQPVKASLTLDYWGHDPEFGGQEDTDSDDPLDFILSQVAAADKGDRVRACSHQIHLEMRDSGTERMIDTASDVNSLLLGYALTVHKSQGSEWRRVFLCIHQSHAAMVSRELLYTAVTRAREELYVICEPDTFTKGIQSQRVKGNTLAEKAEYFKGKADRDQQELLS